LHDSFKVIDDKAKIMATAQPSSSKYQDPDNKEEILNDLKNCPTLGHVNELINKVFPDWQVGAFSGFCSGYPHLNNNWHGLCARVGVKPTEVLAVRELNFEEDHIVLRTFVECLTRAGFAVRKMTDYVPCSVCSTIAVPTPSIHEVMKEKGITVPDNNVPTCMKCRST